MENINPNTDPNKAVRNRTRQTVVENNLPLDKREDPQFLEPLLLSLRNGNRLESAAISANLRLSDIKRWMDEGSRAQDGTLARRFYNAVRQAENAAESFCVEAILNAHDWRGPAWWLERRRSKAYGNQTEQGFAEYNMPSDTPADGSFTDEEKKAVLKALLRRKPELIPAELRIPLNNPSAN